MNRAWGWKRRCKNLLSGWWDARRSRTDSSKIHCSRHGQPLLLLELRSLRVSSVSAVWTRNSPVLLDSWDLRNFAANLIVIYFYGPRNYFFNTTYAITVLIVFMNEALKSFAYDSTFLHSCLELVCPGIPSRNCPLGYSVRYQLIHCRQWIHDCSDLRNRDSNCIRRFDSWALLERCLNRMWPASNGSLFQSVLQRELVDFRNLCHLIRSGGRWKFAKVNLSFARLLRFIKPRKSGL